jgi:hypothetical protein
MESKMRKFTVKSFVTRNSTCPSFRYRILVDGKRNGNVEFGNFQEAERFAVLQEVRSFAADIGVAIDMEDGELLAKLRLLFGKAEGERQRERVAG